MQDSPRESYSLAILQAMGWDVRFPQGTLQSYNLTNHGMECKILPGNLTISQTTPSDGMQYFHKPPHGMYDCNLTILQTESRQFPSLAATTAASKYPGCRTCLLERRVTGSTSDCSCSIAFFRSFRALALAASSLTSRFRLFCWVSHFLYFGVPLGGTPMARAKRKQGVCTHDAWAYSWLRGNL